MGATLIPGIGHLRPLSIDLFLMRVSSSFYDLRNQPSKNFCYTTSELVEEIKKIPYLSYVNSRIVNSYPIKHPELKNYRRKKGNMWMWHKYWRSAFIKARIPYFTILQDKEEEKEIKELKKAKDIVIMLYDRDHMSKKARDILLQLLDGLKIFL